MLKLYWQEMAPKSQAMLVSAVLVLALAITAGGLLVWVHPERWISAIGMGVSMAAVGLCVLALRFFHGRR